MNLTMMALRRSSMLPKLTVGFAFDLLSPISSPRPQPSLRVPVTPANRRYLRALRAAEAAAWEAAGKVPRYALPRR